MRSGSVIIMNLGEGVWGDKVSAPPIAYSPFHGGGSWPALNRIVGFSS